MHTKKTEHCPIDSGKLLRCFKQKDDLFRIRFQKVSLAPLWKIKGMRVKP